MSKKNLLVLGLLLIAVLPLYAAEKKAISGYGPFDFNGTATPDDVEKAGGSRLSTIVQGEMYAFQPYDRFEGVVEFLQYHKLGKIPPARQAGSVPRITSTEVRLEEGRLWLIILNFNPNDYDDYLRVIKLEYGEPSVPSKKKKSTPRKDLWLRGDNCITLTQVAMDNLVNGGQLEIQKGRCEGRGRTR
jgi:hypothetical protein